MTYSPIAELRNRSPYSGTGSLTREQFLFFEMRTMIKNIGNYQEKVRFQKMLVFGFLNSQS